MVMENKTAVALPVTNNNQAEVISVFLPGGGGVGLVRLAV